MARLERIDDSNYRECKAAARDEGFVVRPALMADAPVIAALSCQLGYETGAEEVLGRLEIILGKSDHLVLVAESRGKVVGFISMEDYVTPYSPAGLNVTGLVVDEAARGEGVGSRLLDAAEERARSRRLAFIRLNSGSQRLEAHRFYRGRGFDNEKDQKRFIKNL